MDLFKLLMNLRLGTLPSSGARIPNCVLVGDEGGWQALVTRCGAGGTAHLSSSPWGAVTNYSICSSRLLPKQTN